jgi:hypothetical protein
MALAMKRELLQVVLKPIIGIVLLPVVPVAQGMQ